MCFCRPLQRPLFDRLSHKTWVQRRSVGNAILTGFWLHSWHGGNFHRNSAMFSPEHWWVVASYTIHREGRRSSTTHFIFDPILQTRKPLLGDRAIDPQDDLGLHHMRNPSVLFTDLADGSCVVDSLNIINSIHHANAIYGNLAKIGSLLTILHLAG